MINWSKFLRRHANWKMKLFWYFTNFIATKYDFQLPWLKWGQELIWGKTNVKIMRFYNFFYYPYFKLILYIKYWYFDFKKLIINKLKI